MFQLDTLWETDRYMDEQLEQKNTTINSNDSASTARECTEGGTYSGFCVYWPHDRNGQKHLAQRYIGVLPVKSAPICAEASSGCALSSAQMLCAAAIYITVAKLVSASFL